MAEQRYNVDHTPSSQAYAGSDPNEIKKYAEDETYSEKGAEADNSANISYPTGGRLALITVALMLVIFLAALDQTILGTAIPKITDEFSGLDKVSWYGTAYFMTSGGFQSSWGKAPRYFSLKGAFLTALAIFELGSLLCAVAPNAEVFIVGRAIAGLGCAGLVSESMTIVAFSVEPTQRPKFLGFVGSCYGLGSVCGPLIGGAFTSHVTWRWCFYLNLPIGAIAAAVVIFSFSTPVQAKPLAASWRTKIANLDPGGAMLMMAVIVCFTLAMQYGGQTMAWGSTTVVGLLVGFAVILVLFTAWQFWRGDQAMMPPRVVAQRTVWPGAAFQFFFAAPYFIALYYLPIYFQSVDDVSPIESGIRNMPLVLGMTFSTVAAGIVTTKTGYTTPLAVLGATLATVACGLFYTFDQGTSTGRWIAYQLIGGISWGTAWQVALNNMQARVETADVPTAVSTYFSKPSSPRDLSRPRGPN